ncbi:hypothetical protein FRB99_008502 [Tulasnella sp. 403]|nr:hypothetical protein FRB99_008502 [Tulasnella sp. 403]
MQAKASKYYRNTRRPNDYYNDYDKLMDEQDRKMLRTMNANLDILLILAALFAGLNGAFIVITLAFLTPGATDTTNALLHILIQRIDNSTTIPSDVYPTPTFPGSTRINCYFSASLACSLVVALGAIIGKQWLIYYDRNADVDPLQSWRPFGLEHQGRERLRKHRGLQRWQLHVILEAVLPTLLQLAVLIFFIGLIDFTLSVTSTIGWVTLGLAAAGFVAYMFTIVAALWDPDCPFQTPVTRMVLPTIFSFLTGVWSWASQTTAFLTPIRPTLGQVVPISSPHTTTAATSSHLATYKYPSRIWSYVLQGVKPLYQLAQPVLFRFSKSQLFGGSSGPMNKSRLDELYAPSTEDIEVVSWILSTSMEPEALRTAAESLPYLHVPSVITTVHLDVTAIHRLEFLFRDALRTYLDPKTRSATAMSDLNVYGEALSHVLLASFIEARVQSGPEHPRVLPWWRSYDHCITLAWFNELTACGEFLNSKKLSSYVAAEDLSFTGMFETQSIRDQRKLPLHVAAILCSSVSSCQAWSDILDQLYRILEADITAEAQPSPGSRRDTAGLLSIGSMVSWALSVSLRPIDSQSVPSHISAIWDAYTDDDTLSSNFLEACRLYKDIAENNDAMMDQVWVRLYKYVIRSVRTLIRDMEDADIWDKAASGGLLVASVVACRGSKEGQLESARAMVQDCLDIVPTRKNPRRQVPFSALTPLWPILSEDIPVDILEAIIGFIMKFTEGRSSDLTDMFYDQPETTDRVIDLLGHREEKLRIHSLNLLTKGVQSALPSRIPHGLTTRDFARLLGRQLKHSMPTHREGMFMAIREFCFAVSLDRSRWALAFCDEALTQSPVCLGTMAIALVLWDGIPRWEHDHTQRIGSTDWFSDGLIKAVTEYLVAMSNSSDSSEPWQDSNEYITKAVESYHDAVVSSKSAAGSDGVGKEPLTEAFTRWKSSRSDRVDAKSPPVQAKHDTEPDRKVCLNVPKHSGSLFATIFLLQVSGHGSNGLDFVFSGVDY